MSPHVITVLKKTFKVAKRKLFIVGSVLLNFFFKKKHITFDRLWYIITIMARRRDFGFMKKNKTLNMRGINCNNWGTNEFSSKNMLLDI